MILFTLANTLCNPTQINRYSKFAQRYFSSQSCPRCGQAEITASIVKDALAKAVPYESVPALAPRCLSLSDDSFAFSKDCQLAYKLRLVASAILKKESASYNVLLIKPTTGLFMSAFLKKALDSCNYLCDLTGDGGLLIWQSIQDFYKPNFFSSIIDLGGQDAGFLKRFPEVDNRILVDLNILAPFLNKDPKGAIAYALGDAVDILKDESLRTRIKQDSRPKLISMSNLLSVLSPEEGMGLLAATVDFMQFGDTLAITCLSDQQFEGKDYYYISEEANGIVRYNRSNTKQPYKSCLREDFGQMLSKSFPSIRLIKTKDSVLYYQLSSRKKMPVRFRTLVFKKELAGPTPQKFPTESRGSCDQK